MYRTPLVLVLLAVIPLAGAKGRVAMTATPTQCKQQFTQREHARYTRSVFSRDDVTRRALHRVQRQRVCQHTPEARRNALARTRRWRRAYRRRTTVPPILRAIAWCESKGDPRAVSASGTYRGKYQFDRQTWSSVGGRGDPASAPEGEQDRRAMILLERRGTQPWPICGSV